MHGPAIYADPEVAFQKLPNIEFSYFILLRANQAKRYYKLYISTMLQHLRVIFLHFPLKNRNRLLEFEFHSCAV